MEGNPHDVIGECLPVSSIGNRIIPPIGRVCGGIDVSVHPALEDPLIHWHTEIGQRNLGDPVADTGNCSEKIAFFFDGQGTQTIQCIGQNAGAANDFGRGSGLIQIDGGAGIRGALQITGDLLEDRPNNLVLFHLVRAQGHDAATAAEGIEQQHHKHAEHRQCRQQFNEREGLPVATQLTGHSVPPR